MGTPKSRATRVAIAAVIVYQALLIGLILLRPDLDPEWHTISEWAIGRHGWIMQVAFLVSATGYAALAIALRPYLSNHPAMVGGYLLALCALGTILVGLFVTDPMPLTARNGISTRGLIHILGGSMGMLLLPPAALLINLSLASKAGAGTPLRAVLRGSAPLPAIALVAFASHLMLVVMPMGEAAYGPGVPLGWPPRLLFLCYGVWVIILAGCTPHLARQPAGRIPRGTEWDVEM